jgi:hypothetical protein
VFAWAFPFGLEPVEFVRVDGQARPDRYLPAAA